MSFENRSETRGATSFTEISGDTRAFIDGKLKNYMTEEGQPGRTGEAAMAALYRVDIE